MKHTSTISSPIGKLTIMVDDKQLTKINFADDDVDLASPKDEVSKHIIEQLRAYFKNPQHVFDIDYFIQGTAFQKRVWKALQKIAVGKTLTYGQLAKKLDSGPRAIGQACRTNSIPLIIPCHRIVAAGALGGFAGKTKGRWPQIKTWLLEHEAND